MRAQEFITEMQMGTYMKGGITPTKAPDSYSAYKRNSKIAYDIVKTVSKLPTSKEKFEYIFNLKDGQTSNSIRVVDSEGVAYGIKDYNADTGEVTVSRGGALGTVNIDDLEFKGKERSISSTKKTWIFSTPAIQKIKSATARGGRPPKSDSSYSFPNRLW